MTYTAGQKVRASDLNATRAGIVARAARTTNSTTTTATTGATAQGVVRLAASVTSGRLYRVSFPNLGIFSSVAEDLVGLQATYTTDGSTPTVTSSQLVYGESKAHGTSVVNLTALEGYYTPGSNQTLTVLLSLWRVSGTGAVAIYGDAAHWPCSVIIEDLGVDVGATGVNI